MVYTKIDTQPSQQAFDKARSHTHNVQNGFSSQKAMDPLLQSALATNWYSSAIVYMLNDIANAMNELHERLDRIELAAKTPAPLLTRTLK